MRRSPLAAATVVLALAGGIVTGCGEGESSGGSRTISWYVFNEPGGAFLNAAKRCTEQSNGRYSVRVVNLPTDADQQRELVVRRLAAKDPDIDIIGMDVNWTAEFAEAEWLQPWEGQNEQDVRQGTIPALLETGRFEDRLYGAPLNTNTQLLWYRKDLVDRPPETWDEMIEEARRLKKQGEPFRIEAQGARYEGLVVWFNTLYRSAGGPDIVDGNGRLGFDQAAADKALGIMATVGKEVGSPSLSNNKEDDARLGFQSERAAFQVNYSFIYASAKSDAPDFVKKIGWAPYPAVNKGEKAKVTLGGINLGISRYSRKADLAFDAAKCLRNEENQVITAEKGGLPPTLESAYQDERVKKAFPYAQELRDALSNGVPRPVTPAYADISLAIQSALHPPRGIDPEQSAKKLRDNIEAVRTGGLF